MTTFWLWEQPDLCVKIKTSTKRYQKFKLWLFFHEILSPDYLIKNVNIQKLEVNLVINSDYSWT